MNFQVLSLSQQVPMESLPSATSVYTRQGLWSQTIIAAEHPHMDVLHLRIVRLKLCLTHKT